MAKRLQVVLKEAAYRQIQRAAHASHMSVSEWVRQQLDAACLRESTGSVAKKLKAVRAAVRHDFPVGDMESMLAEIDAGRRDNTLP